MKGKRAKSEKSKLREFGLTMGCALAVLGALLLWRGRGHYICFLGASAVFFLLGLAVPVVLRPVEKVWMLFSRGLAFVMTRVILTVLFFVAFTPIGLLGRLFGKRFLNEEMDTACDTYWLYREPRGFDRSEYERQF